MPTVQVEAQVSLEELVKAAEQLSGPELDTFADKILALRAARRAPRLSAEETDLLQKIYEGVPPDLQGRYDELIARRRAEVLTPEEHSELLSLTEQVERIDARRLEHMVELARLRGMTLRALVEQLGLRPRAHD